MIIYNLFPLLAGAANKWESHIERAADMGFEWIFVNPIEKSGMSGSLYSIADYFAIDPRFVDPESELSPECQVEEVTQAAERHGLRLMIDLVINHCAVDSELTRQHPEWFARNPDGSIVHPSCIENGKTVVWGDLARFDHEHTSDPEGLYRLVYRVVEYLIQLGFTGFRCDAAYQIPSRLWHRLISEVKKRYPKTVFTAETLGCTPKQTKETARAGFDYVYNSSKWWDYKSPWLMEQYQLIREVTPSIAFPESHDTERLFQEEQGNEAAVKRQCLFTALFSAGFMIPIGFEFGFRKRLHVVKTRPEDWEEPNINLCDFIRNLNATKKRYKIFGEDCPTKILPHNNPNILLLQKTSKDARQEALIVLNKDVWHHQPFNVDNLSALFKAKAPLRDVSPEYGLDQVPAGSFSYNLRAGQGIVLVSGPDTSV